VWRNAGARAGDVLVLTKPLGTGVLATALKQGRAAGGAIAAAVASMSRLNRAAAEALEETKATTRGSDGAGPVHAVTDITGFGLLGHAREMAAASGVSFEIEHRKIAFLPGAVEAARGGFLAGGLKNNREFVGGCVGFADSVAEEFRNLLFDPQTSGGLMASLSPEAVPAGIGAFERRGVEARAIGRVIARTSPLLHVV